MSEEFFTPQEVAEKLKVSRQMVLNKIHSGQWECQKISARTYRFSQEQFDLITSNPAIDQRPRRAHSGRRNPDSELHRALRKISGIPEN